MWENKTQLQDDLEEDNGDENTESASVKEQGTGTSLTASVSRKDIEAFHSKWIKKGFIKHDSGLFIIPSPTLSSCTSYQKQLLQHAVK